jgi:hypothetical protein
MDQTTKNLKIKPDLKKKKRGEKSQGINQGGRRVNSRKYQKHNKSF